MGIRAEGADHETRGIEARRAQLQSRPMLDISGEQSDERAAVRFIGLERAEQLRDARIELCCLRGFLQLGGE